MIRIIRLILFVVILVSVINYAQVVKSTIEGGSWSASNTWIGNQVPSQTDSVIIQGEVIVDSQPVIKNLEVAKNGVLSQGINSFTILDNVLINGTLNLNHYNTHALYIGGNLEIHGSLKNDALFFTGTSEHKVFMDSAATFSNPKGVVALKGKIVARSDLYFSRHYKPSITSPRSIGATIVAREIDLSNGYSIFLNKVGIGSDANLVNAGGNIKIDSIKTKILGGELASIYISSSDFDNPIEQCEIDNISLTGDIITGINVDFYGKITNNGKIISTNQYSKDYFIDVNGSFINNGEVSFINNRRGCNFNITKDFENNGTFDVVALNFVGYENHYISNLNNHLIWIKDSLTCKNSQLVAKTDIELKSLTNATYKFIELVLDNKSIKINGGTLGNSLSNYKTTIVGSKNAKVEGSCLFENINLDDLNLDGTFTINDSKVSFYSGMTNFGLLIGSGTLTIYDDFINQGDIKYNNLTINLFKSFYNYGELSLSELHFYGSKENDQFFNNFNGNNYFQFDHGITFHANFDSLNTEFQWWQNGNKISGETNSNLTVSRLYIDSSFYQCLSGQEYSRKIFIGVGNPNYVDVTQNYPTEYSLFQNYPNPFNPNTVIDFALPRNSNVSIIVFNSLGEEVAELVNGKMNAGYHSVHFDATNLSSGIYFYRISAGHFVKTNKMILLR